MHVIKRNGRVVPVLFDKITARISKLCYGLSPDCVDPVVVSQKVIAGLHKGITTSQLDELAAETAAHMSTEHPDYAVLAARIAVSNLHKNTTKDWLRVCSDLREYVEPKSSLPAPLLSEPVYDFIERHGQRLSEALVYERDFGYDYFGFKTLERSYLLRLHGKIVERPQHMLMRVACGIHFQADDVDAALETYELMSQRWFTHASPTLFSAGLPQGQLSSCFLLQVASDSIEGIYDTLKQCAMISKQAGGVGLAVHKIRATGSYIRGTNGTSNGLVPMLRVFNNTARYVDQGGGKRKGAFAVYLEPWHPDILEFLDLRKNRGVDEIRARDMFYALWTPDLFMKRVEADGDWSLFCPNEAPGLHEVWGPEFEALYTRYEAEGRARRTLKARELWAAVIEAQIETGTPYVLYKDACNAKSNQGHLGTIQCSNLCTEIVQFTAPDEIAVCNLASVALPMFVTVSRDSFDFAMLQRVVRVMTRNLNRVIDVNAYPVPEARRSNLRHRPIGLGVQGLADAFMMLGLAFDSRAAQELNSQIFECVYYAALAASNELAQELGPHDSYEGSPASRGLLQQDLWPDCDKFAPLEGLDWPGLRDRIQKYGLRNSLLVAPMPTASTSQILGNNECFEPYTSNLYVRRTLAGEFVCVNKHLLRDLVARGLWTPEMKRALVAHKGSVQRVPGMPQDMKEVYKTAWEISGKTLLEMAASRGRFVDQSQSLNVFMAKADSAKLTSMHFYGWKLGLKTGMYYLRTQPAADAIQFTVDPKESAAAVACSLDNKEACASCSS